MGADAYRHINPLSRAVADARGLAESLSGFGYATMLVENPTLDEALDAFEGFASELDTASASFIFFAGHAVQVRGRNFLLPVDFQVASLDAVINSALSLSALLDEVSRRSPLQSIVLLDACRDNPLPDERSETSRGIVSVLAPPNTYVAYSAGSNELALDSLGEGDAHPNSLFTRTLLRKLQRNESFDAVVKSTRAVVRAEASRIGHRQNPAVYDQTSTEINLAAEPQLLVRTPFPRGGTREPAAGHAECAIIAQADWGPGRLEALDGPYEDAVYLRKTMVDAGYAAPRLMFNCSRQMLLAGLGAVGDSRAEAILLYFCGHGYWNQDQALHGDPTLLFSDTQVSLSEVCDRVRRPDRHIVILWDVGLWSRESAASPGIYGRLLREAESAGDLDDVCLLFSAGPEGESGPLDVQQGMTRSPFAIAVANAIGRGAQPIGDFFEVVKSEVVAMTEGYQVPMLLGTATARARPFPLSRAPPVPTTVSR